MIIFITVFLSKTGDVTLPTCNMICTSNGHRYAAVLPLPVLAIPIISRPLNPIGTPCKK